MDLHNPAQYDSPPLHIVCVKTKSTYQVRGRLVEKSSPRLYKYLLPSEITGRCFLSLGGGMEPKWPDGSHEITIQTPDAILATQFPGTSASFAFSISHGGGPDQRKELHLFKVSPAGLPHPFWYYTTTFVGAKDGQKAHRSFVIPYVSEGNYLAYLVERGVADEVRYVYAKAFTISREQLVTHDHRTPISEVIKDGHKITISFDEKDVFDGAVAAVYFPQAFSRYVAVGLDGKTAAYEKRGLDKE